MSRYSFFGDTLPSGLAYQADSIAQAHGVTLGFIIGYTPSLTVPRRLIGFRQWITADQVAAGLDLTQTFTWILWAAPNNAQPLYQASILARGNASNLVVGNNDFFFPDQYAALVDTTTGNPGRYMLSFYYPPGNAFYNANPTYLPSTGFGQILSTVDPSNALYTWYGFWGGGAGVANGGWYSYGNPAGVPPQNSLGQGGAGGTASWYGIDILVDDLSPSAIDKVGISDTITVSRGGLPSSVTATGTATDTLSVHATATDTVSVANVQQPVPIVRSLLQNSGCYHGAYPSYTVQGPSFRNDGQPIVPGVRFHVEWDVQLVGCNIFKPPLATGAIVVNLWNADGTMLATTTVNWVSDNGGWRQVLFDSPVQLFNKAGVVTPPSSPNIAIGSTNGNAPSPTVDTTINQYIIGWQSPTGDYCATDYAIGTFARANGPIVVDTGATPGGVYVYSAFISMPNVATYGNYWVDPIVQWIDTSTPPAWGGDPTYWKQWANGPAHTAIGGSSAFWFPIGVFWPDQGRIAQYMTYGVKVVMSGGDDIDGPGYADAIVAAGAEHHLASLSGGGNGSVGQVPNFWNTSTVLQEVATNPAYAALVKSYSIADEPDQGGNSAVPASSLNNEQAGYMSPDVISSWITGIQTKDSTRPIHVGLDHISDMAGVFFGEPVNMAGDEVYSENERRKWGRVVHMLGGDWYFDSNYGTGQNGIWAMAAFTRRLREIADDRIPIIPDLNSAPTDGSLFGVTGFESVMEKGFWAQVIAGAAGIGLFDHWFPPASGGAPQMDNYMLQITDNGGTDAVRQKVLAIFNFIQTLGSAMVPKDLGLVTAWTSSNTTAGPIGGVTGVPIHFTTRSDALSGGTHHYLFAQGIRPGATTATITMPSVISTTLTVLNESRTVTTDATGTFTDTFAADYSFHLYRW